MFVHVMCVCVALQCARVSRVMAGEVAWMCKTDKYEIECLHSCVCMR